MLCLANVFDSNQSIHVMFSCCLMSTKKYMLCLASLSFEDGAGMPLLGLSGPYIWKTSHVMRDYITCIFDFKPNIQCF